jgi:sugar/nucleoside kinase (ribokinase family)
VYLADHPPIANQKITAAAMTIAAGGPATNAAVTFAQLGQARGDRTHLWAAVGAHPLADVIRADLAQWGVMLRDLQGDRRDPPPLSSVVVTAATGDRAVISRDAQGIQAEGRDLPLAEAIAEVDWVAIDGHQGAVALAVAQAARLHHRPVILGMGRWKPGSDRLAALATHWIGSPDFCPPDWDPIQAEDPDSCDRALQRLQAWGIPHVALTRGPLPIRYATIDPTGHTHRGEIPVPRVPVVDTLGAGDTFHGAVCHFLGHRSFPDALAAAAAIAAHTCQFFGPRTWLQHPLPRILS